MNPLELLARTGFLVKGLLYIVIGVLALQVVTGLGGRVTGTRGALMTVLGQPFGRMLLLIAAISLFGYAVWRVLQGLLDSDGLGHEWRAIALRVSYVGRGAVYAALGLQVVRIYRGLSQSSGTSEREIAAEAFRWPFGDWLVVLGGLALIGFAVQQVYAAITSRLERNLDLAKLRRDAGEWAVSLSRFGMAARGVVFALLGWFVVGAGLSRDPSEVGTTASSMRLLAAQPVHALAALAGVHQHIGQDKAVHLTIGFELEFKEPPRELTPKMTVRGIHACRILTCHNSGGSPTGGISAKWFAAIPAVSRLYLLALQTIEGWLKG